MVPPLMPDLLTLALMGLIVTGAFVAKGAVGFGEALIMVPLFVLLADMKVVLPVVLLTTICADVYLLAHHHGEVSWEGLWVLLLAAVVGVVGGTWALGRIPGALLQPAFGVLVFLFSLRMLLKGSRATRPRSPRAPLAGAAGGAAGFIDAMMGTGGPPAVIYFDWLGLGKSSFRATFVLLAFVLHTSRIVAYWATGLIHRQTLITAACLLLPMVLGAALGRKLHSRLDERLFSRVTAGILMVVSLRLLLG